jgi:hypothetical protein
MENLSSLLNVLKGEMLQIILYVIIGAIGLVAFLLRNWFRSFFEKLLHNNQESAKAYSKSIDNDAIIYSKLGVLLEYYSAARVWFGRLHNGIYFSNGESFKKYSINYMITNKGVSWPVWYPRAYQDVPLSIAYELMSPLFKDKVVLMKTSDFQDRGYFKRMLQMDDTEEILCILVESQDKPVGFIGISWTSMKQSYIKDPIRLKEMAEDLGFLLSFKDEKKNIIEYLKLKKIRNN